MSLVDSNGQNLTDPATFDIQGNTARGHAGLSKPYSVKLSEISENIPKFCDSLNRLNIKIIIFTMDLTDHEDSIHPNSSGLSSMTADYKRIFESGEFSDLIIRTSDNKELKLHKFPLMARSITFSRMFNVDMAESENGSLDIKDFDSIVLTELFRFIYYNQVENLSQVDMELFKAAEKYLMDELKEKCLQSIFQTVMRKEITEVLQFADFYGLETLFEYAASVFMT